MTLIIVYQEINVTFIYLIIMNAYLIFENCFRLKEIHRIFESELYDDINEIEKNRISKNLDVMLKDIAEEKKQEKI